MCKYCDSASNECEVCFEPLTQEYFLNIQTSEWDTYNDDWVYQKEYISYCPWCGRDLENKVDFLKDKTPVLKFTTNCTLDYVDTLYKTLVEKYPNLICIPQSFDIDWWSSEDFEKYITTVRQKFKSAVNELEEQNKGCPGCLHFGKV